jgi:hypothetical protein
MPVMIFMVGNSKDPIKYLDPYDPIQKKDKNFRVAKTQRLSLFMDGVCMQFLLIKLVMSLKKIQQCDWVFTAIERTARRLFSITIILASGFLVYVCVLWFLFGPSMY